MEPHEPPSFTLPYHFPARNALQTFSCIFSVKMGFPIPPENIESRHYINGEFCESSDKGFFELKSPYSHEKISDICEASTDDTNRAVAAAKAAFPAWAAQSPAERGTRLKQLATRIRMIHNELAQLNAMDMGRPVCEVE
jgi:aldehyde dehydrogenase (NAD+)